MLNLNMKKAGQTDGRRTNNDETKLNYAFSTCELYKHYL